MKYKYEWQSPIGTLRLFAEDSELTGLYFENHTPAPKSEDGLADAGAFRSVIDQLEEYFAGDRTVFDFPVTFRGTEFQAEIWSALQHIPYGGTTSYGTLAKTCGRPNAMRAVGAAVGRNPISIVIPCHRVLGAGGTLTGFAGGLSRKQRLLEIEKSAIECRPSVVAS